MICTLGHARRATHGVGSCKQAPNQSKLDRIGPHTAALGRAWFARLGRPGQRAIYGLASLPRTYTCAAIEAVCQRLLDGPHVSFALVRRALERHAATTPEPAGAADLTQAGEQIRPVDHYQWFWDTHGSSAADHPLEEPPAS